MISTRGLDGSLGIKVLDLQSSDGNDVGSYKNGEPKTRLTKSGISKVCAFSWKVCCLVDIFL